MNEKFSKVIDHPDLVRDMNSKAVLASDLEKYQEHRQKKHFLKSLMDQGKEIDNLKQDINDIKQMLIKLTADK